MEKTPLMSNKNNFKDKKEKFFNMVKTKHSYHLVDPSPWPLIASLGAFMLTTGLVACMHKYIGGKLLLITGFCLINYVMYTWWRDVIREATFDDHHNAVVQRGLRLGMVLFILSEIMFFFAFFWAFFHSSIAPAFNIGGVWPPAAISTAHTFGLPFLSTTILLTSGASITWAHHALLSRDKEHAVLGIATTIGLATIFTCMQTLEYYINSFELNDGVYGSCFYMTTGFHGFHVIIGTSALKIAWIRLAYNHFTKEHHFGLESAIWYWHFVDVVWLFLFMSVYWWGNR